MQELWNMNTKIKFTMKIFVRRTELKFCLPQHRTLDKSRTEPEESKEYMGNNEVEKLEKYGEHYSSTAQSSVHVNSEKLSKLLETGNKKVDLMPM